MNTSKFVASTPTNTHANQPATQTDAKPAIESGNARQPERADKVFALPGAQPRAHDGSNDGKVAPAKS